MIKAGILLSYVGLCMCILSFGLAVQVQAALEPSPLSAPLAKEKPLYLDHNAPLDQRVDDLIGRMTLEEKAQALDHRGPTLDRFGLRSDQWNQCLNGVRWPGNTTTLFPSCIALGATWDPDLVHEVVSTISDEARAIYNGWKNDPDFKGPKQGLIYRDPVINISRNPYWGRINEVFSEDTFLTGRIGVAYVKALQGNHPKYLKLASTLKHYAVNNKESDRTRLNAIVADRWLREYWLPHFRDAVVEAKASSLMASYNAINNVPNNINHWLLTDLLKNEWKHEGFVVSDLGGVRTMVQGHAKSKMTYVDAVAQSIMAGCDFSDKEYMQHIPAAVKEGKLTVERLDDALRRVMKVRMRLGEFDPQDIQPWSHLKPEIIGSQKHRQLSLKAANKTMTLLQNNNNFLPLNEKEIKSLAVIGPFANRIVYSHYSSPPTKDAITPLDGLKQRLPKAKITYVYGALTAGRKSTMGIRNLGDPDGIDKDDQLSKAIAAAKKSDVAIIFVGTDYGIESEGHDRKTLRLTGNQQELVEAVHNVNPQTVVVYITAGPISEPWTSNNIPAVLQAWWPGEMGGLAIADALLGRTNPGGRLPYTVYASDKQVPSQDEYDISKGFTYMYLKEKPLYPFGHGLSYTKFQYSDPAISQTQTTPDATVIIKANIKNTGNRTGDEVVQIYATFPKSNITRPTRQLVGFKRITLNPDQQTIVEIPVQISRLAYWDEKTDRFTVQPGNYNFHIAASSADLRLQCTCKIN